MKSFIRINSLLLSIIFLFANCGRNIISNEDDINIDIINGVLFVDVTTENLPTTLNGFSMDAHTGDLDNDGDLDIIIASEFRENIMLLNDGTGKFTDVSLARLPRTRHDSEDVGIADFDSDGDFDIIIVSEDDQINELYFNDGKGFFTDVSSRIPVTGISNAVLVEDINNDSFPDILIGNNGSNFILINDGTGNFVDESNLRFPTNNDITQDIELGDVDNDGDLDLLLGNENNNSLWINKGNGFFEINDTNEFLSFPGKEETREADFGDVDNDGDLDIIFANIFNALSGGFSQNRLLLNDGFGHFTDVTTTNYPNEKLRSFDADFIDLNDDGYLDILTSNLNFSGNNLSEYEVFK